MKVPRIGLSLLPAIALLAIPSAVPAAYLVPPENSAATQYTEVYPTAGGNRNVQEGGKGSPKQVLGEQNARKLEARGPEGQAAAEVAAETAPVTGTVTPPPPPSGGDRVTPGSGGDGAGEAPTRRQAGAASDKPSAIGEVLGRATGSSSSGETGLLLPLAIGAAIAWAMAYLWRQRKRQTA